jgi:hypothetical protein
MKIIKLLSKQILFLLVLLSVLSSCEAQKRKKHHKKNKDGETSSQQVNIKDNSSGDCDTGFWKYVYNPSRLDVIKKCKTVTGVIEESSVDDDGDQHMLLKLDKGQDDILTERNMKKKQGDLVIEAVCANKPVLKKVGNTCNGYINKIQLPKIGDHVSVTGSLVIDSHNGWAEIHPITKLEVLK